MAIEVRLAVSPSFYIVMSLHVSKCRLVMSRWNNVMSRSRASFAGPCAVETGPNGKLASVSQASAYEAERGGVGGSAGRVSFYAAPMHALRKWTRCH